MSGAPAVGSRVTGIHTRGRVVRGVALPGPRHLRGLLPSLALTIVLLTASRVEADAWWSPDKGLHFAVSTGLGATLSLTALPWIDSRAERFAWAVAAAVGVGLAKELLDTWTGGSASFRDLAWDLAGAVTGAVIGFLLDRALVTPLLEALAPRFG